MMRIDLLKLMARYPNRPHNHSKTLLFGDLIELFNQLNDNRKKPTGPTKTARRKVGPSGPSNMTTSERRDSYIEQFISKWRSKVGNDFYPALRLMLPEKDRDRGMYGLKEKTIGKLFVKILGINKNSDDASALINWKLPGQRTSTTAGDFAARCNEVIGKRAILFERGKRTIADVNAMLDKLSVVSKENEQQKILEDFYHSMDAEELMWLIRIMLRQMKVGATEKTILHIWHPDAENLFNISSSLRRVCWELYDPSVRLNNDESQIALMQCFQPQLAGFPMSSMKKIVESMRMTEDDEVFWIEDKLDGERMQMHMMRDDSTPGGVKFGFWSRKAKNYTYLYGNGFEDPNGSMTRHLESAFEPGVKNIILDGEMITWDMTLDAMVAFGSLKTAALSEQRNQYSGGRRPLFRVFDCLYLNNTPLTKFTLRDRRKALERSVKTIHRRLEIHSYMEAKTEGEIESALRQVVLESSEGLVVKDPRSMYKHDRTNDWIKVKPEYMSEFGEELDCVIVGGYFGSGHRGGRLSSFLCALRYDDPEDMGYDPQKCWSFFKVGGGMSASDYQEISHITEGKWKDWDPKNPPTTYIELGGGDRQFERPDQWILPEDSVVVAVKAASVHTTPQFRTGFTLRFPRFKSLRNDKTWNEALSLREFHILKQNAYKEHDEKQFKMDTERKSRRQGNKKRKRPLQIVGDGDGTTNQYSGPDTKLFEGLKYFIVSGSTLPEKKSKGELEDMVKANGGSIIQSTKGIDNVMCISENLTLKAKTMQKEGKHNIIKPAWIFDCIEQNRKDAALGRPKFLLPFEPWYYHSLFHIIYPILTQFSHMFHTLRSDAETIAANVDEFGDSFCRDLTIQTLGKAFATMPKLKKTATNFDFIEQLEEHGVDLEDLPGTVFRRTVVLFQGVNDADLDMFYAKACVQFGHGNVVDDNNDPRITHVVLNSGSSQAKELRAHFAKRSPMPRMVALQWVTESWEEKTLLDEDRTFLVNLSRSSLLTT
jgi:DNA ligase-4